MFVVFFNEYFIKLYQLIIIKSNIKSTFIIGWASDILNPAAVM